MTSSTSSGNPKDARILIIGTGVAGLRTAKTLLDDGFKSVHLVSETLSAGGIWALDDSGMSYPGLLTNSGIGDYEFSTAPMKEDPEFLKNNEDRLSGATVGRYLEDFYEKHVQDRAGSIRFGHRVVHMDRIPGESTGWKIELQNVKTGEISTEVWDKVVLSVGIAASINLPSCFTDLSAVNSFQGMLTHSSRLTSKLHDRILSLPSSAKIVVIGGGKSAADIAQLYGGLGRDVTLAFRQARLFAAGGKKLDALVQTRIGATLSPHKDSETRLEWFLHKTRLGAFFVRRMMGNTVAEWLKGLRISPDSPLYFQGSHNILYFGPSVLGGRAMSYKSGFHSLAAEGKIKLVKDADPVGISSDGRSVVFKDGRTLEADVIVCATGFGDPITFIPQETKKQLGLSLEPPCSPTNPYEGLADFLSLQPVPGPPRSDPANHVYRGILPSGALESRDLVVCGGALALKTPFICEISSHWISSFFLQSSHLKLPSSTQEAFDASEDHAQFIRARYPLTPFPWGQTTYCAWFNTDQYVESIFEDMGVESNRREAGMLGLGFVLGNLRPSAVKDLGEERRALRVASGEE
ncbi:hypothetical protein BDY24DRAFT_442760 [Mrakia frigida]|uniref:uncharacterized protein n=1 Tax=Mrakia frigida TaxID=29902 RepID=UPI003FCC059D